MEIIPIFTPLTYSKKNLNKTWQKSYESMTDKFRNYAKNIVYNIRLEGGFNKIWD